MLPRDETDVETDDGIYLADHARPAALGRTAATHNNTPVEVGVAGRVGPQRYLLHTVLRHARRRLAKAAVLAREVDEPAARPQRAHRERGGAVRALSIGPRRRTQPTRRAAGEAS